LGDIYCRKCGEPWDSYGVHASLRDDGDMSPEEARRFLRGEGCPSCKFGEAVPEDVDKVEAEEGFLESVTSETDEDPIEVLGRVKAD